MKYFVLFLVMLFFIGSASAATLVENGDGTWNNDTYDHTTEDGGDGYIKTGLFADNFNDNSLNGWTSSSGVTLFASSKGYSAYLNGGDLLQKNITTSENITMLYSINLTEDEANDLAEWILGDSSNYKISTAFRADYKYYSGSDWETITSSTDNIWYTVRTDIDFTAETSNFYLDDVLHLSDISFRNSGSEMKYFKYACNPSYPLPYRLDDVRILYTDPQFGNFTENLTASLGVGEEIANVSFNSSSATGIISIDLYGSIDNSTYVLIQSNASDDTVYDVSGDSYEYIRYKLVSTQVNQTMYLYNTTIWIDTVAGAAPIITSYAPSTPNSSYANVDQLFNFTSDETGNHTYTMNGVLVQTNLSVTTSSYTNTSVNNTGLYGLQNLTMVVENVDGSDSQKIDWTILNNSVTINNTYWNPSSGGLVATYNITNITAGVSSINILLNVTRDTWNYNLTYSNGTEVSNQTATSTNESLNFSIPLVEDSYNITESATGAPDTIFEYWDGDSWEENPDDYHLWFVCFWNTSGYPDGVAPNAEQSGSQHTLRITNNGSAAGTTNIKFNESSPAEVTVYIDDDYTVAGATVITNSYQAIGPELAPGENVTLSAWVKLENLASVWEYITYVEVQS